MDNMYVQMVAAVREWDPFGYGADFYETEAVDVVQIVDASDDIGDIANKIQRVYFQSFEEVIAIEKCEQLAGKLLTMKQTGSCG